MEKTNIYTIHWREDAKKQLKNKIEAEKTLIKYLKKIIEYFTINNIEKYKKFDKRDLNKIQEYLKNMIYYNNCQDNFSIHCNTSYNGSKTLYCYINNEQQYTADISIFDIHLNGEAELYNVKEQAKNRLLYVEEKLKQNKKLYNNFDKYIAEYNKQIKKMYDYVYKKTNLNNIFDIYIYAGDNKEDYEE